MIRRSAKYYCRIDVTAFVSVMIALLVLFMVRPIVCGGGGLDVPLTEHAIPMPQALREDAMYVSLTKDGKIFFGSDWVNAGQIPPMIREALHNGAEKKVYIRADGRTKYGDVAEVLARIRAAGVEKIGILAQQGKPRFENEYPQ